MKKVLLFVAVISVVSFASSCKKTTTCKYSDGSSVECTKCNAASTKLFKSECTAGNGTY